MKLPLSAKGKLKIKHLSSFITGGGGRNEGESHGFHEEGKTVIANRAQRGGGAIRH